jgi:hypothetical protein
MIGGVMQTIKVSNGHNVLTRAKFRALRLEKLKLHHMEMRPIEVEGVKYRGTALTTLKNGFDSLNVQFFISEEEKLSHPTIDEEIAKRLKLVPL